MLTGFRTDLVPTCKFSFFLFLITKSFFICGLRLQPSARAPTLVRKVQEQGRVQELPMGGPVGRYGRSHVRSAVCQLYWPRNRRRRDQEDTACDKVKRYANLEGDPPLPAKLVRFLPVHRLQRIPRALSLVGEDAAGPVRQGKLRLDSGQCRLQLQDDGALSQVLHVPRFAYGGASSCCKVPLL